MSAEKEKFFRDAAKGFAASTLIYRVDSLVHVEDRDDIWFWQQVLSKFRPGKYKFRTGSRNENDKETTGCTQCLKYMGALSQRFFVCIDSDLRYLLDEDISAGDGALQTYTYSWENHCCFAEKLQQQFEKETGKGNEFDFKIFLERYSEILYKPFLLMLYCERNGQDDFSRDDFKRLISLQYIHGDETDNGRRLLERLATEVEQTLHQTVVRGFEYELEAGRYNAKGLDKRNVYLYARGHNVYNLLKSIGERLCAGTGVHFELNILKSALSFTGYEAIEQIKKDIAILNTIRMTI